METFMMLFYVIASIVMSSKLSAAFSIDREDMNTHNPLPMSNSYSDWSVGPSTEDDAKERFVRDVTESPCDEPSEADLMDQLRNRVLAGDDLRTDHIPEQQMVPKWEEVTGMGVYVQNGRQQLLPPSALFGADFNRRTTCPWTKTFHTDFQRYPRTIYHARCLCIDCTDWSQPDHLSHISTCQPITKQITVLRRGECINGTYSYDFEREPVIIGCVCSRSSDQASRNSNSAS